ncbi:MAG: hypothetical protein CV081_07645 [Nitrospira sp. LK265]|nr:hypothetical protein [Nitrospira sp. LK265]
MQSRSEERKQKAMTLPTETLFPRKASTPVGLAVQYALEFNLTLVAFLAANGFMICVGKELLW